MHVVTRVDLAPGTEHTLRNPAVMRDHISYA
jgi:hypothetical protein